MSDFVGGGSTKTTYYSTFTYVMSTIDVKANHATDVAV